MKAIHLVLAALAALCACEPGTSPVTGAIQVVIAGPAPLARSAAAAAGTTSAPLEGVRLTVSGPVLRSVTQTSQSGGFFDARIEGLPPGPYTVDIEGLIGGEAAYFGRTTEVNVVGRNTATATIQTFAPFAPVLADLPVSTTTSFSLRSSWSRVLGASGYVLQSDGNPTFANPQTRTMTDTSGPVVARDTGMTYLRVRASNDRVSAGGASAVKSFRVVRESADTSDASAAAQGLGFTPLVSLEGNNIAPAGDVDWYSLELCNADSLIVTAAAVRLDPPSPLNTLVQVYAAASPAAVIAFNDDGDSTDAVLRMKMSESAVYLVRVSSSITAPSSGPLGHYRLDVRGKAGVHNLGTTCRATGGG